MKKVIVLNVLTVCYNICNNFFLLYLRWRNTKQSKKDSADLEKDKDEMGYTNIGRYPLTGFCETGLWLLKAIIWFFVLFSQGQVSQKPSK